MSSFLHVYRTPDWLNAFPALASITDELWLAAVKQSHVVSLPADAIVFQQGAHCEVYMMLLDGCLRIQQVSNEGREMMLYKMSSGQTCVATVASLLSDRVYPAQCVSETPVRLVVMPSGPFLQALENVQPLRDVVFRHFSENFHYLMGFIEQMAFGSVEMRLSRLLLDAARLAPVLHTTHDKLAREVGSDRAVITRKLKELELKGLVKCGRSQIQLNLTALQRHNGQH